MKASVVKMILIIPGNMKKIVLFWGVVSLLAACTAQLDSPVENIEEPVIVEEQAPVFYASIGEDAQTKVYLDEDYKVLWTADDRISVFNENTYNQEYRFDGATGDNSGSFSIVPDGKIKTSNPLDYAYAVYPYSTGTSISNTGVLTVNFPADQTYTSTTFGLGANTMVAVTDDSNFQFKNACGYLMFKLYGTSINVKTISLKGNNNEKIAGEATIAMSLGGTPTITMSGSATDEIVLTCTDAVTIGTTSANYTEFWFAIPPVTFSNGFTVTVTDDEGKSFVKTTSSSFEIVRSYAKKMAPIAVKTSTDLSANGTANCYIVTGAGDYRFKATRGNTNTSVGSFILVDDLWESFGTDTAPSCGDLISNLEHDFEYIYFTASNLKGNAVICVKDHLDNTLWSWHIWLTDQPAEQVYNNSAGTMMDRNLGATSATPGTVQSLGLFYQWGRKDPFLGSRSTTSSTQTAAFWPGFPSAPVDCDATTGTIEYTIAHPTTFVKSDTYNADWYYTGTSSTDDTRWGSVKTQYDPCPAGWRVPDGGWSGVWYLAFGKDKPNVQSDNVNNGKYFGKAGSSLYDRVSTTEDVWYPSAGRLNYNGAVANVGAGYYSSVSPYTDYAPMAYTAFYLSFVTDSKPTVASNSGARSEGWSVRCVKIQ